MSSSGLFSIVAPAAHAIPMSDGSGLIDAGWLRHGDITGPGIFIITNGTGAVLGTGTTISLANEPANQVWAGPTNGSAAAPSFRPLVAQDLPIVRLKTYTVSTLPAGAQGDVVLCTNLSAPTFLSIATGGGSVVGPVFYNGTNWICF